MTTIEGLSAAQYWQLRALSEQRDKELLQGQVAALQKQIEIMQTERRIDTYLAALKADGVLDMTEGTWRADDAAETFVRVEQSAEQAKP